MTDIELYQSAYEFLLGVPTINDRDLKLHLTVPPAMNKPKDFKIIYKQLCISAQNKQMSPNVIGKAIDGIENIGKVLFDFDHFKVVKKYSIDDWQFLFDKIKNQLKPRGQVRDTLKSEWPKYCITILQAAYFLNSFESVEKFYSWADKYSNDKNSKYGLPLLISIEISGFGFPLACDFLKEIGYFQFGKPDVQIKKIFFALHLVDESISSSLKKDYLTAKVIDRIALANNVTPFTVDKIFWLIGSGKFHETGQEIGDKKEDFIRLIREKYYT